MGIARDMRLRALLLTAIVVVVGGLAIAYLPDTFMDFRPEQIKNTTQAQGKNETEIKQRFQQGVIMLHARQYEHALTAFHRVIELSPAMPEAHVNAGFALIGLKRYAVARDFFEGALALRKNQVNAYYGLAEALEGLHDLPGALGAMRTYLHLAPADDPYRRKAESAVWEWEAKLAGEHRNASAAKQEKH